MISEINQANESLNIVVRVMRMWLVRDVSSNNGPFSLDMILMDSTFEKDLKEGVVYSITNFGVVANGGSYRTTRYIIIIFVVDSSDSATFVIFYRETTKLFQKNASQMIESSGEKSSEVLPKDISELIDSIFLFKIESNTNNDTKFERNYRVKKICNTEEIILKFKETKSNTNVYTFRF
ncbi:replication protein A 70 kDa DNA-binding subunit E [Trifolium repens]|nr:replication protein A 70 kDa DNA-binding subunit E [Trifolium repens]